MSSMLSIIQKKNSEKFREEYYKSIQDFQQSQYELKSKQFECKSISKMGGPVAQNPPSKVRGNSYNLFQHQEAKHPGIDSNLLYNLNRINQNPSLIWNTLQPKKYSQTNDPNSQDLKNKDQNVLDISQYSLKSGELNPLNKKFNVDDLFKNALNDIHNMENQINQKNKSVLQQQNIQIQDYNDKLIQNQTENYNQTQQNQYDKELQSNKKQDDQEQNNQTQEQNEKVNQVKLKEELEAIKQKQRQKRLELTKKNQDQQQNQNSNQSQNIINFHSFQKQQSNQEFQNLEKQNLLDHHQQTFPEQNTQYITVEKQDPQQLQQEYQTQENNTNHILQKLEALRQHRNQKKVNLLQKQQEQTDISDIQSKIDLLQKQQQDKVKSQDLEIVLTKNSFLEQRETIPKQTIDLQILQKSRKTDHQNTVKNISDNLKQEPKNENQELNDNFFESFGQDLLQQNQFLQSFGDQQQLKQQIGVKEQSQEVMNLEKDQENVEGTQAQHVEINLPNSKDIFRKSMKSNISDLKSLTRQQTHKDKQEDLTKSGKNIRQSVQLFKNNQQIKLEQNLQQDQRFNIDQINSNQDQNQNFDLLQESLENQQNKMLREQIEIMDREQNLQLGLQKAVQSKKKNELNNQTINKFQQLVYKKMELQKQYFLQYFFSIQKFSFNLNRLVQPIQQTVLKRKQQIFQIIKSQQQKQYKKNSSLSKLSQLKSVQHFQNLQYKKVTNNQFKIDKNDQQESLEQQQMQLQQERQNLQQQQQKLNEQKQQDEKYKEQQTFIPPKSMKITNETILSSGYKQKDLLQESIDQINLKNQILQNKKKEQQSKNKELLDVNGHKESLLESKKNTMSLISSTLHRF